VNPDNDNPSDDQSAPRVPAPVRDLIDRERIRGAARIIPQGTDAKDVTAEQIQQVASDADILIRNHKLSRQSVARSLGVSPTVISEFINGKYLGNNGQIAIDLDAWIDLEERRLAKPKTTQYVLTNVAQTIDAVVGYCLEHNTIGMVYGPDSSGIGKTTALTAIYQEKGPRLATLVTIDKVDANPTGLLRKLCNALRIEHTGSNRQRFTRVADKLKGRRHILLIDQIHNLRGAKDDKPFYILTDLYDAGTGAQLWCGTADLVLYLEHQQKRAADESLAQIRRRIFPRIDLMEGIRDGGGEPLVTVEQVREMFARNRLKLVGGAPRFLCQLANQPDSGSLGLCVRLVEYATMIADGRNKTAIDVDLLKEALRVGFTSRRAELLLRSQEEFYSPKARTA
jgi:DNA transposition AAA+ family ATPase